MDSYSKFWGNLEGIWGNPGEIPHIGWKIPGVYRVKVFISTLLSNCKYVLAAIHNTTMSDKVRVC